MKPVSRILVVIDLHGDPAAVLSRAARLGRAFGAALELFAPVYNPQVNRRHFPETGQLERARQRLVRSGLDRLAALAAGLDDRLETACEAAWDHPAEEAVIRRAAISGADLVVAAARAHPEHRLPFLAGSDWQLVRHCPVPLLMCLPGEWKPAPVVVAALDPIRHHGRDRSLDVRILRHAAAVAEACGGVLRAFHAYEAIVRGHAPGVHLELPVEQAEATLESGHARALEAAIEAAGVRPGAVDMREREPRDALPGYCRESGADVVVMGAIARNPLGRIFIGSTAEKVLEGLPCDLLVVKPEGFRAPVAAEPYPGDEDSPVIGVPGI